MENLTAEVLSRLDSTPDPRLREIMRALVRHLHAFTREVALTDEEWLAGVKFLTATGQMCDDTRQEFILLSDTLGLSMLVDEINHGAGETATESTVLGPFYVAGAPLREYGESIVLADDAPRAVVSGVVRGTDGKPIPGALLDIWQTATNGLYDVQDPSQPPYNLRGRFHARDDGSYRFVTVRPAPYPIPDDGPVGGLLRATDRHPWRAAHIHAIVSADGYRPVTTHIFPDDSPYLDSDAVFGVKDSLVRRFVRRDDPGEAARLGVDPPYFTVDHDFVLAPR
ncbi:MAG TPA: intradiol ring-cleavage dioxygenase [Streptosporangiaceae bacterium]